MGDMPVPAGGTQRMDGMARPAGGERVAGFGVSIAAEHGSSIGDGTAAAKMAEYAPSKGFAANARAAAALSSSTFTPGESECDDLMVEVDESRVFMEGICVPFNVRLTTGGRELHRVRLEIQTEGNSGVPLAASQNIERLRVGMARVCGLNFCMPSGVNGLRTFSWTIAYEVDGEKHEHEGQTQHSIYPATENAGQLIDKVMINIQTGHASDVNFNADGFLRELRAGGGEKLTPTQLVQKLQQAPPVWRSVPLYETECARQALPSPAALVTRLTLRLADGGGVHLVAEPELTIGKNRRCGLVTRFFGGDGRATEEDNMRISRLHATLRILPAAGGVAVCDGGIQAESGAHKASAYGIWLDGQRAGMGRPGAVGMNRTFELLLGDVVTGAGRGFLLRGEVLGSERARMPSSNGDTVAACGVACVLLRRGDNTPELTVWVLNGIDVGLLYPSASGILILRRDGAFAAKTASGWHWLEPGTRIGSGTAVMDVLPWSPWGLGG